MKTIVISTPKSGTYLLREILESIGMPPSHLHLSVGGVHDYSKVSLEQGRANPSLCYTSQSLAKSLKDIPDNGYGLSHLFFNEATKKLLSDFNIIFVSRDIRGSLLSRMRFWLNTGRVDRNVRDTTWKNIPDKKQQFRAFVEMHGAEICEEYYQILRWQDHASVVVTFDELKNDTESQIATIANAMGRPLESSDVQQIADSVLGASTLTKSAPTDVSAYYSEETDALIANLINQPPYTSR